MNGPQDHTVDMLRRAIDQLGELFVAHANAQHAHEARHLRELDILKGLLQELIDAQNVTNRRLGELVNQRL